MRYIFDIDGTICYNESGDYKNSIPYSKRISKINKLYESGHEIFFFTARGMGRYNGDVHRCYSEFYSLTHDQLKAWGIKFHGLMLGKPSADFYIDDKGIKDEHFFTD